VRDSMRLRSQMPPTYSPRCWEAWPQAAPAQRRQGSPSPPREVAHRQAEARSRAVACARLARALRCREEEQAQPPSQRPNLQLAAAARRPNRRRVSKPQAARPHPQLVTAVQVHKPTPATQLPRPRATQLRRARAMRRRQSRAMPLPPPQAQVPCRPARLHPTPAHPLRRSRAMQLHRPLAAPLQCLGQSHEGLGSFQNRVQRRHLGARRARGRWSWIRLTLQIARNREDRENPVVLGAWTAQNQASCRRASSLIWARILRRAS
jgi:hypothetical protein